MTQWYRLKEYSTQDKRYSENMHSTPLPLETIVRVLDCREEKNGWFEFATLREHPELYSFTDRIYYTQYYFAVRLQPVDDLEVFKMLVERSNTEE